MDICTAKSISGCLPFPDTIHCPFPSAAFQRNPTKMQKTLMPPCVNPRKEKTMKQFRTNVRALHQHIPHSKTATTMEDCLDILAWAHMNQQAERCHVFLPQVIRKMPQHPAHSSGSGKVNLLFTLIALGNFVPLTKGDLQNSSTITVERKFPWKPKPPLHFKWM